MTAGTTPKIGARCIAIAHRDCSCPPCVLALGASTTVRAAGASIASWHSQLSAIGEPPSLPARPGHWQAAKCGVARQLRWRCSCLPVQRRTQRRLCLWCRLGCVVAADAGPGWRLCLTTALQPQRLPWRWAPRAPSWYAVHCDASARLSTARSGAASRRALHAARAVSTLPLPHAAGVSVQRARGACPGRQVTRMRCGK